MNKGSDRIYHGSEVFMVVILVIFVLLMFTLHKMLPDPLVHEVQPTVVKELPATGSVPVSE